MEAECPNIETCKLVTTRDIVQEETLLENYMMKWCKAGKDNWSTCTRYITKNQLKFCPDFVLPDTQLTPDEVIEKFDSGL